ncbi:DsbA family protein [Pseudocolwellia sp. HL-MZ19]|uniref:DsbA family protein n=1 Tax=Pseudocolwellia sp. HL-MZ19 TaxID=3400846 RepID=UPI003CF273EC
MNKTLIYVHDPMCSWCWGFEPVRSRLFNSIDSSVSIKRFVGGLAPDSNEPMPQDLQNMLKDTWRRIEQNIPGTVFNFDFWTKCQPRRSTYPSNRAIIAARQQGVEYDEQMTHLIQSAYYSQAKNPSDESLLIELASELSKTSNFNCEQFINDLGSKEVQALFEQELDYTRSLGVNGFPSLVYQSGNKLYSIGLDYNNADNMLAQIKQIDALS